MSRAREARVAAGGGRGGRGGGSGAGGRAGGGKAKEEKRDSQLVKIEQNIRDAEDQLEVMKTQYNNSTPAEQRKKIADIRGQEKLISQLRKRQQDRIKQLTPTVTNSEKVPAISKEEEARLRAEAERIRLEAEAKAKAKAIADAKAKAGGTPAQKTPVKKGSQAASSTGRTGRFK